MPEHIHTYKTKSKVEKGEQKYALDAMFVLQMARPCRLILSASWDLESPWKRISGHIYGKAFLD